MDRLHMRREYRERALEVAGLVPRLERLSRNDVSASQIALALDESSAEARLVLRVASDDWLVRQRLDLYQRRLRNIRTAIDGDDLMRLGIPQGRVYREILEQVRVARLDNEVRTREEEEALALRLYAAQLAAGTA